MIETVPAEFARNLERELSTARAALAQCEELLAEMTARAMSLVLHLPPETLAGDVQRWRDEVKAELAKLAQCEEKLRKAEAELAHASEGSVAWWVSQHDAALLREAKLMAAHAKALEDGRLIDWFERSHRGVTAYEESGLFGTKRLWRIDGVPDAGKFQPTFRDALREAKAKYDKHAASAPATGGKGGAV